MLATHQSGACMDHTWSIWVQGGAPVRERVQLVNISTITFGLIRGLYL